MKALLLRHEEREFLVSVDEEELHTDLGVVDLRGLEPGTQVETHLGARFDVLRPRAPDFFRHAKRTGAPLMPKDIGLIIAHTGLNKNDVVLDAGTGSGILATYLGEIAHQVISYERREDFARVARENIQLAGLDNVEVRCGDVIEAMQEIEESFDVITLDLGDAHRAVGHARGVLRPGGYLAVYSPFFEQAKAIRVAVDEEGYEQVRTVECVEHDLDVGRRGTRPSTRVAHTGWITLARR